MTKNSFINATVTLDTNSTFDAYLGEQKILEGEKESGMYRVNLEVQDSRPRQSSLTAIYIFFLLCLSLFSYASVTPLVG